MLSAAKVTEVRRLLDEGLSQRAVAEQTGVSRGTVSRIARGDRRLGPWGTTGVRGDDIPEEEDGPEEVPRYRCPGCGVLVVLDPCQVCVQLRAIAGET